MPGPSIMRRVVLRTLTEKERSLIGPDTQEFVNLKQQMATTQDRVRRMLALLVPDMLEDQSISFDIDKMEFYRMVPPQAPPEPTAAAPTPSESPASVEDPTTAHDAPAQEHDAQ